jgi:cytochrome c
MLRSDRFARAGGRQSLSLLVLTGLFASMAVSAQAADAAKGKAHFDEACAMCHSAVPGDGQGGMGPNLYSLNGKAAGTGDKAFPYTAALKGSKLVWNAATLDRFLTAPGKVVPGTEMVVSIPAKATRDDVVAYLLSAKKAPARK